MSYYRYGQYPDMFQVSKFFIIIYKQHFLLSISKYYGIFN